MLNDIYRVCFKVLFEWELDRTTEVNDGVIDLSLFSYNSFLLPVIPCSVSHCFRLPHIATRTFVFCSVFSLPLP